MLSVAVHVTKVEPTGNTAPELWSHEIVYALSESVAVAVKVADAPLGEVASHV